MPPIAREVIAVPSRKAFVPTPLGSTLLARMAAPGGATRSEIVADLAPLFSHKLSPAEWRRTADHLMGELTQAELAAEARGRFTATPEGIDAATRFLGIKTAAPIDWPAIRDRLLLAKGLGIECEKSSRLKMLARPEGLRALILQHAFNLPSKKNPSPAKLRAQLALVALERAFGNKIKTGLGKGSSFTAKAGRTLAGQLSINPRDFGTDQKLVAQLAAEQVGALQQDFESLRAAILKRLGSTILDSQTSIEPKVVTAASEHVPVPANDREPPALSKPRSLRPDLAGFARAVKAAARTRAEGWPGNRKAFISHVWQAIRAAEPAWDLSEIEFKCMLAEAHRMGSIVLANADLKDKSRMQELESSAISYKNTVWHFVRVED
jgi:hypothetical protein